MDRLPRAISYDLVEDIGELDLVFVASYISDVRRTDYIVHAQKRMSSVRQWFPFVHIHGSQAWPPRNQATLQATGFDQFGAAGRLPMVKVEKDYTFDGPNGKTSFKDLFEGRRQLIVYHFMFDPTWDKGCSGCTGFVDALGDLSLLNRRDTTFTVVSRAPLAKLDAYKAEKKWNIAWFPLSAAISIMTFM